MSSVPLIPATPSLADLHGTRDALVDLLMLIARKCPPSALQATVWDTDAFNGKEVHYNIILPNVSRAIAEHMTHIYDHDAPPRYPEPGVITRVIDAIKKSPNVDQNIRDYIGQCFDGCTAGGLWYDREKNAQLSDQSYITISFKVPPSDVRPVTLPAHKSRGDHTDTPVLHQDPMTELILAIRQLSDTELRSAFHPFADRLAFRSISQSLNSGIVARK